MDQRQEILAALQPLYSDDGAGAKRLLRHAIYESRKFAWRTGGGKGIRKTRLDADTKADMVLAEGMSLQDIVFEAMDLTLKGKRPWNKTKYPNIANHLKWAITSLIQNLASSGDNDTLRPMPEDDDGNMWDVTLTGEKSVDAALEDNTAEATSSRDEEPPPEVRILQEITGLNADDLATKVFDAIGDDAQLLEIYGHLMDYKKPRHIMETMKLSSKDVYRLTQKLRRRLIPVLGVKA